MDFAAKFEEGLSYQAFLEKYGSEQDRQRWQAVHSEVELTAEQIDLLGSFQREMKVLVLAGAWCGDCVDQCPIFDHFTSRNDQIRIRFFDRDDASDLTQELSICGGKRVPILVFLSEDGYECGRYGDRTLSKYRKMGSQLLGAACSTGVTTDHSLLKDVTQEWLNEFERIQLMLRTSGRLREKHGD